MKNDGKGTSATAIKPQLTRAVVQWKGEQITITFQDVKNLICPLATEQEIAVFLKTCQSLQLNPFANECFLIKYDTKDKAAFVIAIDSYLKAAEANKEYDGCEAGIILRDSGGKLELREGAFILEEERPKLVGGWAKVYRRDRSHPTYVAVNKAEAIKLTREGTPTRFWTIEKQPWMLRKTALKRSLVEAFPSLFAGTLATAEVAPDDVEYRALEDELPPAFENNGEPAWAKFWARAKDELGITQDKAHELLGVESVKQLIEQGRSLEEVWNLLVEAVRQSQQIERWMREPEDKSEELFDDSTTSNPIDMDWLKESLDKLQWVDVGKWLIDKYKARGTTVRAMVESLTREQQEQFCAEVQRRLEARARS